ncbi:MAG TPA: fibronectin type III domain-containing protein [Mycobacteriales bacterium]|jgi:hypothetical protein|nr:fibronectin type III domain-containing protein [Mycobacteriales bacterium]
MVGSRRTRWLGLGSLLLALLTASPLDAAQASPPSPSPPTSVSVVTDSATNSARVSWTPSPRGDHQADTYVVSRDGFDLDGRGAYSSRQLPESTRSFRLTRLKPGEIYRITVAGCNEWYYPDCPSVAAYTTRLLGRATAPSATSPSRRAVTFTWRYNAGTSVDSFDVRVAGVTGGQQQIFVEPGDTRTSYKANFTSVPSGSRTVQVRARKGADIGPWAGVDVRVR